MVDDATAVMAGHTKKYNIPLSHFEYKYIQNCKDGKELERIYKELTGGEIGAFPDLEKLALDRIRDVKPNSQILRQDKAPLDRSALPEQEQQELDDFLNEMKQTNRTTSIGTKDHQNNGLDAMPIRSKSIVSKSITPTISVINKNGKPKRIVPRSYDEWGKLDRELNSDNDEDKDDDEDDDDDEVQEKPKNQTRPTEQVPEKSQRLKTAEQHRLNGNTAFKSNNYQQSIDLYTKSLMLDETNPVVYMNRAIAHYKLNNYDESLVDCTEVLSKDPHHIKALFRRASCHIAKQQYDEARRDLDILLTVDEENLDAKNLLKTIPTVPKNKGVRIPITEDDSDDDQVEVSNQSSTAMDTEQVKIPILEVEEEEEEEEDMIEDPQPTRTNEAISSMNIDIPQKSNIHARPCIDSQEASPAMFDSHFHHRDNLNDFQHTMDTHLSSPDSRLVHHSDEDDDDDGMALGDEASAGLLGNMSDDDGNVSRSLNVSPTMEDDEDDEDDGASELVEQKPLQTPPVTPIKNQINNQNLINQRTTVYPTKDFSPSEDYSSTKQNSTSINKTYHDLISNSNFSPTIQNWLRNSMNIQSNHRSSYQDKPWTKSARPWSLDRLQRDIERFHRLNDHRNALEASKKMLKNGVLDYHQHAEHIVNILNICAQSYSKINEHFRAIQYATEALQFNKTDSNALTCRAKAFEIEKFLLFSYADYARVPSTDLNYQSCKNACQKLIIEMKSAEDKQWREKLPKDADDIERYLAYAKIRDQYVDSDAYDWYRLRGNQLYLDACFVLAIRCYTHAIELKPNIAASYSNRAACYLKVFEPRKALDDCNKALEIDSSNVRALYRKACAHKMLADSSAYKLTLETLIKAQPNNQTILSEYFTSQHEQIPRKMRRLRAHPVEINPPVSSSTKTTTTETKTPNSTTMPVEESILSYEELEELRLKKTPPFSPNTRYQYTQQLDLLKSHDMKSACSFVLRLPPKGLFKVATNASVKLIETIVLTSRTMIYAEKRYQQENKSSILPFSYITLAFNLLVELTTLPRLDSTLAMIDSNCRTILDDLLTYFASISTILSDVNKLERLRK